MTMEDVESSFDPTWRGAILGTEPGALRDRLDGMLEWARSRIDHLDRSLAGRDLVTPTRAVLVHLTERATLVAVLCQLAGAAEDELT